MRLKSIHFSNYRAFRSAVLPLEQLTVLIGANGSGKTSALSSISTLAEIMRRNPINLWSMNSIGTKPDGNNAPSLSVTWDNGGSMRAVQALNQAAQFQFDRDPLGGEHANWIARGRVFTLDSEAIAEPVSLVSSTLELRDDGYGLPAVLTTLQDREPEQFEELNKALKNWLPEYDRIVLDTVNSKRALQLRTATGKHRVSASKLSDGTRLSLALLTICHLPEPPTIVGLEEPDYGLHPRLLRQLKDSLLRLTKPREFGLEREPVQVVVTTHSPYFLDLFKDELESIVITQRQDLSSSFTRLKDLPHVDEIIQGVSLGEMWYSGVLGGVPEKV